jgi:ubiquinone/menaquinone biosynthesis C-methylase UbiE
MYNLFFGIILGLVLMKPLVSNAETSNLITHTAADKNVASVVLEVKERTKQEGDKPDSTVEEQLKLIDELAKFEFGRFLLVNRGINGFWTRHMVLWPKQKLDKKFNENSIHPLDYWLLSKAPSIQATQERFIIFQKLLQESLKENIILASIPCGMMDDLLTLNYSNIKKVSLIGIDLDKQSLDGAKETADQLGLREKTKFVQANAWELNGSNEYDVITSNGLNIYEKNDDKVVLLYKQFYNALKPGGVLISSFLTPPPVLDPKSPWEMKNIDMENLRRQKVIFTYILSAKWQTFRTETKTIEQLKAAGFKDVQIIYDKNKIFPTFKAIK